MSTEMKDLLTLLAVLGAFALLAGFALCGCPLRDPVPVDPNYPDPTPFAARDASPG